MKKKISILVTFVLATLFAVICFFKFSFFTAESPIHSTVFMNDLPPDQSFDLKLIYADAALTQIESFSLSPEGISPTSEILAASTEAFLPKTLNQTLLQAVNDYRATKGLAPLAYFYQVTSMGDYAFASSSEGLDALYWIHLGTNKVQVPHLVDQEASEPQYVYHISKVNDTYFILTAGFNALTARLYSFSPTDLELRLVGTLETDQTARSSSQYALDASGNAFFTHTEGMDILNPSGTWHLSLPFTPDQVVSCSNTTLAVSVDDNTLVYALISPELELLATGRLSLPHTATTLVTSFLQDDFLYTITYDASHPLYRYYISIYDLTTQSLVFCSGLSNAHQLALLKAVLID